jgi:hypothetical protein
MRDGRTVPVLDTLKATLADFRRDPGAVDGAGRLRLLTVGVVAADVLVTLAVLVVGFAPALDVRVSFEPSFPSNLLVLKSRSGALGEVEVEVDARYVARVEVLGDAPVGIEIERDLRDGDGVGPPREYRPRRVVLRRGDDIAELEVAP